MNVKQQKPATQFILSSRFHAETLARWTINDNQLIGPFTTKQSMIVEIDLKDLLLKEIIEV